MLDRWSIGVTDEENVDVSGSNEHGMIPFTIINNYFSIGVVSH